MTLNKRIRSLKAAYEGLYFKVKMGFKRAFDEDYFQEFPPKHPRQVDFGDKLTLFTEIYPCHEATQKDDIPGEDEAMFCRFELDNGLEHDNKNMVSDLANKEFEISAPFSLVNSTSEDDTRSAAAFCSSYSPECLEFYFPRRSIVQFDNTHSLLNGHPQNQIPIGPNHQAEIPEWEPQAVKKCLSSIHIDDASREKLMGDCVLPMCDPDLHVHRCVKAGDGRKGCLCPDPGSIRCVRQHVKESRERIRGILGQEKFMQLGLCDMGEEVSEKWTEEEGLVFHEVVYSNPMSHGKNFWEHLSVFFPSRTKKEIVNYYFNVFMLRRRAVQNRSSFLDIDSDDDEWQGSHRGFFQVTREDEDSAIECLVDQGVQFDREDDYPDDDDNYSDDSEAGDGNEDSDKGETDDCNGDSDAGNVGNIANDYDGRSFWSKEETGLLLEGCKTGFIVNGVDKISQQENFDAQNVSSLIFDCQPDIMTSFGSSNMRDSVQESGVKSKHKEYLRANGDGLTADGLGTGYLLDPRDTKIWDAGFPMSPSEGTDLISSVNMIEEIFGPCTGNTRFEKKC